MTFLSREALLAAAALPLAVEKLEVPELGGYVYIRMLSGTERDAWEKSLIVGRGKRRDVNTENVRAKLAVQCLVDEHGTRLFTNGEAVLVGRLPAAALNKIYEAAQRLNGVDDEDVDELKKASEWAGGSGSPTN